MADIRETSIYVIGVGGTGSKLGALLSKWVAATYANQPRRIVYVDHDVIEESNAERQEFHRLEAGKFKCEVLANRHKTLSGFGTIDARPVRMDVESIHQEFRGLSEAKASVVVFIAVDSALARNVIWSELMGPYDPDTRQYTVSEPKYQGNFTIIDMGNKKLSGQVVSLMKIAQEGGFATIQGCDPRDLYENVRRAVPTVTACAQAVERQPQTVVANEISAALGFRAFMDIVENNTVTGLINWSLEEGYKMEAPVASVNVLDLYKQWQKQQEEAESTPEAESTSESQTTEVPQ